MNKPIKKERKQYKPQQEYFLYEGDSLSLILNNEIKLDSKASVATVNSSVECLIEVLDVSLGKKTKIRDEDGTVRTIRKPGAAHIRVNYLRV